MPPLSAFASQHKGQPILVMGTGPSAHSPLLGHNPRFLQLAKQVPIIGINRAYDVLHPEINITYQISTDRIWLCLLHGTKRHKNQKGTDAVQESWLRLQETFTAWCKAYTVTDWSLEDFAQAYKDRLDIHPEVWRYLRLVSPNAPFIRFSWENNGTTCPYPAVKYSQHKNAPIKVGECVDNGLLVKGNTAITALHLAAVMGGAPIFVLGVDLTDADPVKRPWEKGAVYRHKNRARCPIDAGFKVLANKIKHQVHVINLNPETRLKHFEVAGTIDEGLDRFEREIQRYVATRSGKGV